MVHLKNFEIYKPKKSKFGTYVLHFMDEEGRDFYEAASLFSEDTVKVCYDKSGNIIQFNKDVTALSPVGVSVVEVDASTVPEDLIINGKWLFDPQSLGFVQKENFTSVAFAEDKKNLLSIADENISNIQDRIDTGQEDVGDGDLLEQWKRFRISGRKCKDGDILPDIPK